MKNHTILLVLLLLLSCNEIPEEKLEKREVLKEEMLNTPINSQEEVTSFKKWHQEIYGKREHVSFGSATESETFLQLKMVKTISNRKSALEIFERLSSIKYNFSHMKIIAEEKFIHFWFKDFNNTNDLDSLRQLYLEVYRRDRSYINNPWDSMVFKSRNKAIKIVRGMINMTADINQLIELKNKTDEIQQWF